MFSCAVQAQVEYKQWTGIVPTPNILGGKEMKKVLALVLAAVMAVSLAACGGSAATADSSAAGGEKTEAAAAEAAAPAEASSKAPEGIDMSDPMNYFWQYDEPFELHIARTVGGDAIDTLEGDDTLDDNWYTRYYLEHFNIKVVHDWTASAADYEQKLALCIASDTLPDAFCCGTQLWKQASRAGLLKDLKDAYFNYLPADSAIRATYDGDPACYEACFYEDEMTSLVNCTVDTEGVSVLMINQNWLDQLGLDVPKNLDDIEKVALAFKEAKLAGDATIPILGPSADNKIYTTFDDSFNSVMGTDAVFTAMGAFPGFFYTDDNGEVVYGSLTQEYRDTLELLAKWYAEGILDPEIGVRTTGWDILNSNQCGMFFGQWWDIGFGNPASFMNDPDADWRAYAVYNKDGKWEVKVPYCMGSIRVCVNEKASDEVLRAVMIIEGAIIDGQSETTEDAEFLTLRCPICPPSYVDQSRQHVIDILEDKVDVDFYKDDPIMNETWQSARFAKEIIPNYTSGQEFTRKDFIIEEDDANWQPLYSWLIGDAPVATVPMDKAVSPEVPYYTKSMETYWDGLWTLEQQTALSIITGQADITAFDTFVETWKSSGGDTIMEEVKAELQ